MWDASKFSSDTRLVAQMALRRACVTEKRLRDLLEVFAVERNGGQGFGAWLCELEVISEASYRGWFDGSVPVVMRCPSCGQRRAIGRYQSDDPPRCKGCPSQLDAGDPFTAAREEVRVRQGASFRSSAILPSLPEREEAPEARISHQSPAASLPTGQAGGGKSAVTPPSGAEVAVPVSTSLPDEPTRPALPAAPSSLGSPKAATKPVSADGTVLLTPSTGADHAQESERKPLARESARWEARGEVLPEGTLIGGCEVLRKIGQGGMGAVYLARHQNLDKLVAVKILPTTYAQNQERIERFKREARTIARLQHQNIMQVLDVGIEGDTHYILMQYVEGQSLDRMLKKGVTFAPEEVVRIARETARALRVAHEAGLIHRDIKPDNIMLEPDQGVKVLDFGLAKEIDPETDISRSGKAIGTPYYMSPEQCQGKPLDGRSDLYSLGVTMYHLLTGQRPFVGQSAVETALKHVREPLVPPIRHRPELPASLNVVVVRLLEKRREDRFADCDALIDALDALGADLKRHQAAEIKRQGQGSERVAPPSGGSVPAAEPARPVPTRLSAGIHAAVALLALAAVAAVLWYAVAKWTAPSEERARAPRLPPKLLLAGSFVSHTGSVLVLEFLVDHAPGEISSVAAEFQIEGGEWRPCAAAGTQPWEALDAVEATQRRARFLWRTDADLPQRPVTAAMRLAVTVRGAATPLVGQCTVHAGEAAPAPPVVSESGGGVDVEAPAPNADPRFALEARLNFLRDLFAKDPRHSLVTVQEKLRELERDVAGVPNNVTLLEKTRAVRLQADAAFSERCDAWFQGAEHRAKLLVFGEEYARALALYDGRALRHDAQASDSLWCERFDQRRAEAERALRAAIETRLDERMARLSAAEREGAPASALLGYQPIAALDLDLPVVRKAREARDRLTKRREREAEAATKRVQRESDDLRADLATLQALDEQRPIAISGLVNAFVTRPTLPDGVERCRALESAMRTDAFIMQCRRWRAVFERVAGAWQRLRRYFELHKTREVSFRLERNRARKISGEVVEVGDGSVTLRYGQGAGTVEFEALDIEWIHEALRSMGQNADSELEWALFLFHRQRTGDAQRHLTTLAETLGDRGSQEIRRLRAWQEPFDDYRALIRWARGRLAWLGGARAMARSLAGDLDAVAKYEPSFPQFWMLRGELAWAGADYAGARRAFERADATQSSAAMRFLAAAATVSEDPTGHGLTFAHMERVSTDLPREPSLLSEALMTVADAVEARRFSDAEPAQAALFHQRALAIDPWNIRAAEALRRLGKSP